MKSFLKQTTGFLVDDDGTTAVEYAMMILFVVLAALSAVTVIGQSSARSYGEAGSAITITDGLR